MATTLSAKNTSTVLLHDVLVLCSVDIASWFESSAFLMEMHWSDSGKKRERTASLWVKL